MTTRMGQAFMATSSLRNSKNQVSSLQAVKMFDLLSSAKKQSSLRKGSNLSGIGESSLSYGLGGLELEDSKTAGVKIIISKALQAQKKLLIKSHKTETKNLKRLAMLECVDFVKRASEEI